MFVCDQLAQGTYVQLSMCDAVWRKLSDSSLRYPLDGCPQSCNGHGSCRRQLTGEWRCACDEGWSGVGCGVAMETVCVGDVDDDEGMT